MIECERPNRSQRSSLDRLDQSRDAFAPTGEHRSGNCRRRPPAAVAAAAAGVVDAAVAIMVVEAAAAAAAAAGASAAPLASSAASLPCFCPLPLPSDPLPGLLIHPIGFFGCSLSLNALTCNLHRADERHECVSISRVLGLNATALHIRHRLRGAIVCSCHLSEGEG